MHEKNCRFLNTLNFFTFHTAICFSIQGSIMWFKKTDLELFILRRSIIMLNKYCVICKMILSFY